MKGIYPGAVLRVHDDDGCREFGRVVHVSDDKETYLWIPLPTLRQPKKQQDAAPDSDERKFKNAKGRLQPYIKRPRVSKVADAVKQFELNLLSTCHFVAPSEWSLSDDALLALEEKKRGLLGRNRRKYARWIALRDESWALIKPIVARATELNTTVGHLLESGEAFDLIERLCTPPAPDDAEQETTGSEAGGAAGSDDTSPRKLAVEQAFFRYLLGGCEMNALLPGWANCG